MRGWATACEGDENTQKNTELMFPEGNGCLEFLDDYVTPAAPDNTFVTWSTRYLVEKVDEA